MRWQLEPFSMPSYESSHEFDKRGHRPLQPQPQPQPQPIPAGPPGPQNPGRYGGPPGNNPRFNNNNRGSRHGGPDRRHQGLKPPAGPPGYPPHQLNHPNIPLPPHPPPNLPAVYPGPGGYHCGPGAGPALMPNMPPAQVYVNGLAPPPLGIANSFGPPPPFPNGPPYPPPPQPYGPTPQGYGHPPMNYPAPPHGYSRRGRGRWEQGPRHYHASQAGGNQNSLPKPPPSLPQKPVALMGSSDSQAGNTTGAGTGDNVESLSYD